MQEDKEFLQLERHFKRKRQKEDEVMLTQMLHERKEKYFLDRNNQIEELTKKIQQLRN